LKIERGYYMIPITLLLEPPIEYYWALANLIFTILGILLAIAMIITVIIIVVIKLYKKRMSAGGLIIAIISTFITIITGIVGIVLFIFTEDIRNPMFWVDIWTIVHLFILFVQITCMAVAIVILATVKKRTAVGDAEL